MICGTVPFNIYHNIDFCVSYWYMKVNIVYALAMSAEMNLDLGCLTMPWSGTFQELIELLDKVTERCREEEYRYGTNYMHLVY